MAEEREIVRRTPRRELRVYLADENRLHVNMLERGLGPLGEQNYWLNTGHLYLDSSAELWELVSVLLEAGRFFDKGADAKIATREDVKTVYGEGLEVGKRLMASILAQAGVAIKASIPEPSIPPEEQGKDEGDGKPAEGSE